MTITQMRKRTNAVMLKHGVDMVGLDGEAALLLGLEYVTLGKRDGINGINFDDEIVPIPNENVELAYNAVRKELKEIRLAELSEKDVEKLQKQIVMGSLYYADYENSFGVNEHEVAAYAEGYLEVEDEYDSFYDYIQSVEWID